MMTQLSYKHLILNYGVCVCGEESKSAATVKTTQRFPVSYTIGIVGYI